MNTNKIPFKKKLGLKLHQEFKHNEAKINDLSFLFWECTLRCNLNCQHCGSSCQSSSQIEDMPAADFLKAIDQLTPIVNPNKTLIVLTGGETLMRQDIEIVGQQLYTRGYPWGVVTNGFLLTKTRLDSLREAGLRSMTVSLDGLEQSHNWLRNNEKSFEKAVEAIKLLPHCKDVVYDVVTCVNRKNYRELPFIHDLLVKIGVENWRIFTIFPTGRAKENSELQLKPNEFGGLLEFIKETREQKTMNLSYGCEGFLGNYEGEVRDHFYFCRAGINVGSILADGSISACPSMRDNFIQGNIYTDNIADVWQHKYQKYRDRKWMKIGVCADCDSWKYCEGNGMHLRDEKTGKLLFCHLKHLESAQG